MPLLPSRYSHSLTPILAIYESLIKHSNAIKSLQREQKKLRERSKALENILNGLRSGYNPNYQDMAVLEAVRGWEFHAGLPHIGVEEDAIAEAEESTEKAAEKVEEVLEAGMWTAEELEKDLDKMLRTDYPGLLIAHEEHVQSPSVDSIRMLTILFALARLVADGF